MEEVEVDVVEVEAGVEAGPGARVEEEAHPGEAGALPGGGAGAGVEAGEEEEAGGAPPTGA